VWGVYKARCLICRQRGLGRPTPCLYRHQTSILMCCHDALAWAQGLLKPLVSPIYTFCTISKVTGTNIKFSRNHNFRGLLVVWARSRVAGHEITSRCASGQADGACARVGVRETKALSEFSRQRGGEGRLVSRQRGALGAAMLVHKGWAPFVLGDSLLWLGRWPALPGHGLLNTHPSPIYTFCTKS
jgi:hypothetical protein